MKLRLRWLMFPPKISESLLTMEAESLLFYTNDLVTEAELSNSVCIAPFMLRVAGVANIINCPQSHAFHATVFTLGAGFYPVYLNPVDMKLYHLGLKALPINFLHAMYLSVEAQTCLITTRAVWFTTKGMPKGSFNRVLRTVPDMDVIRQLYLTASVGSLTAKVTQSYSGLFISSNRNPRCARLPYSPINKSVTRTAFFEGYSYSAYLVPGDVSVALLLIPDSDRPLALQEPVFKKSVLDKRVPFSIRSLLTAQGYTPTAVNKPLTLTSSGDEEEEAEVS